MGPVVIVVGFPCFDDVLGLSIAWEQVLVQALVAQPAIEGFNKTVLHWLAGGDVVPFDKSSMISAWR